MKREDGDRWTLSQTGREVATKAERRERLWQTYLAHQMDVSTEGVHLGMDEIERVLPPETLARLEQELDGTGVPAADRSRLVSARPGYSRQ
ncbi:MAG TPA: iron dependent repressor, metal binding and dimerization domain protein [Thermomicrobiales bacterium]|nr:iron dependent repressor, metal binding and dimerization domain protein [Thermomicrobiales bacterium]